MTGPIFNQSIELATPTMVESPLSTEPVADWERPIYTPVDFLVTVQPESQDEGPVERPQTVQRWVLITPPGTDIPELTEAHKIRLGGLLLMDLAGPPARWPDPHRPGQVHHLEAVVEVVHG